MWFIRGRQMGLQPLVIFKWKKTETQEKEFDFFFFLPSDLDGLKQLCLLQPDQCPKGHHQFQRTLDWSPLVASDRTARMNPVPSFLAPSSSLLFLESWSIKGQ